MQRQTNPGSLYVRALILSTLLICVQTVTAQDSGYVQSHFCDMVVSLGAVNVAVSCFEGARNSDPGSLTPKTYAYSPYFQFETFPETNKRFKSFSVGEDHVVQMRLGLYDPALTSKVAALLSEKTQTAVKDVEVLPLPIFSLLVTETLTHLSALLPQGGTPETGMSTSPEQDITFANLSEQQSVTLTKLIDEGNASFTFTYFYRSSADVLGSYTIHYDDIHNNSIFNQLTGAGASGLVTRNGSSLISGRIARSLTVTNYCEESSCPVDVANSLLTLFTDKMRFSKNIEIEDASQLKMLNSLTIDPHGPDFEADVLSKLHEAITTSKDANELNHKILAMHTEGGYAAFRGEGDFKSDAEATKAIKETFGSTWDGNNWATVPKTIQVFQVQGSDFQGGATLRSVLVKPVFSMRSYQASPVQVYMSAAALSNAVQSQTQDAFTVDPVGATVAFMGLIDDSHPLPTNWLICDGRPLSKSQWPELFSLIGITYGHGLNRIGVSAGEFNLPDLRGQFLRGVVENLGGVDVGPREGNGVGSRESNSTALPKTAFTTDDQGSHSHGMDLEVSAGRQNGGLGTVGPSALAGQPHKRTDPDGLHHHAITSGGDEETRPVNVAVYWIIRAK